MSGYDSSVFVNCPFDSEYQKHLLRPLLFALVALGLEPRIATERSDAGEQRIDKICELIEACRYSVHDLSRIQATRTGEFYRLNMPFELGIDYGCRRYATESHGRKCFLVPATQRYEYMKALSDMNGADFQPHGDEPQILIRRVRNWFVNNSDSTSAQPSPTSLWYGFGDFTSDLYARLRAREFSDTDVEEMPVSEYLGWVKRWVESVSLPI